MTYVCIDNAPTVNANEIVIIDAAMDRRSDLASRVTYLIDNLDAMNDAEIQLCIVDCSLLANSISSDPAALVLQLAVQAH